LILTVLSAGEQIFPEKEATNFRHQNVGMKKVPYLGPTILGATAHNLVGMATWHPEVVHL